MKRKCILRCGAVMLRVSLLFAVVFIFQGCITYTPVPKGYEGPLATVMDASEHVSNTKMYFFQLVKVNGRAVKTSSQETRAYNSNMGLQMTPRTLERLVPSGKTIAHIQAVTYFAAPILAIGGGSYWVEGEVEIDFKPNKIYIVKGELSKDYKAVWIETLDSEIVTEKIEIKGAKPSSLKAKPIYK